MSEFTIDIEKDQIDSPNVLIVENGEGSTTFRGHPTLLRKVIFLVGDVVWPGWCEDPKGRETYLGYADQGKNGSITLVDKGFLEIAWPKVEQHLKLDQVFIYSSSK